MKKFLPSLLLIFGVTFLLVILTVPRTAEYSKIKKVKQDANVASAEGVEEKVNSPEVTHVATPEPVKALYMTACIASLPERREQLVKLIEDTEINSVVIDVKDYTGVVSFHTGNIEIDTVSNSGKGCRVDDMKEFVQELHDKQIYVIGRVTVFQDPLYTKMYPEVAVKSKKTGGIWRDRKGLAFIDVGAKKYWDHVLAIAKASHDIGFDEINFDYIRFPSDGDMEDAAYTYEYPEGKNKREAVRGFFQYVSAAMKKEGVTTSADIFGMTTTNRDDLGIGQVLEYALENFDYVAPMVYPSHYPPEFNGWKDPNKVPGPLIKYVMSAAVARANFLKQEVSATSTLVNGTSTPIVPDASLVARVGVHQLRPWLQDFDYPVPYTADMVRAQIDASYSTGLTSWMMWDPSNTYTKEALVVEQ